MSALGLVADPSRDEVGLAIASEKLLKRMRLRGQR
jgi:hypothetical protein